jgi:hypothetical protein
MPLVVDSNPTLATYEDPGQSGFLWWGHFFLVDFGAELNPLKSLYFCSKFVNLFSHCLEFALDFFQFSAFGTHKACIRSNRAFNALDAALDLFIKLP